ncbi:hypothetical protein B9N43_03605 [Denitratisoma sp. DHT3]|nr:hypothetical protein B9N43_03605 [Denitratisoma sp. DHT3]
MEKTVVNGSYAPGEAHESYAYMTFGTWFEDRTTGSTAQGVNGSFVYGSATDPASIPSTGTASYAGNISGTYFLANGAEPPDTHASMNATVDFSARSLSFSTQNSRIYNSYDNTYDQATNKVTIVNSNATAAPELNMNGTLTYAAGSNVFSGTVTDAGGRSGTATGRFFGPAAEEIGGAFGLSAAGKGTHSGYFVGKK